MALDLARFYGGKTCCPLPPDSCWGRTSRVFTASGSLNTLHVPFVLCTGGMGVCVCIYIFTYLLFLTEIKCSGFEFIPLCSKLLGPPALGGSGLQTHCPARPGSLSAPPHLPPHSGKGAPRDEERGHTPPQVTSRRAYLNATSFLTLRT